MRVCDEQINRKELHLLPRTRTYGWQMSKGGYNASIEKTKKEGAKININVLK